MSNIIKLFLQLLIIFGIGNLTSASEINSMNPTGNILMSNVVELVKLQNLEIEAALKNIEAKKSLLKQARVLPNPEIELESENIYGSGANTGFDNAETTAKLGSIIELGGKSHHRIEAAKLIKRIADLEYSSIFTNIINRSSQLGIEILRHQELLTLDKERLKTNQLFLEEIITRVQKGRLSVVEQKRAKILIFQSNLRIKQREQELKNTKNHLSTMWGYPESKFGYLEEDIQSVDSIPSLNILMDRSSDYVELRLKQADIELAEIEIEKEKSVGIQDLFVSVGGKHEKSSNDKSFVVGVGMPIAIFDQNTGAIEASEFNLKQKIIAEKNASIQVQNKLKSLYLEIQVQKMKINSLKQKIIPKSEEVFKALKEGYLKGKFSYLEVLESQNTLFEFKENYIDVLAHYHNMLLEIELLTNTTLKGEDYETKIN